MATKGPITLNVEGKTIKVSAETIKNSAYLWNMCYGPWVDSGKEFLIDDDYELVLDMINYMRNPEHHRSPATNKWIFDKYGVEIKLPVTQPRREEQSEREKEPLHEVGIRTNIITRPVVGALVNLSAKGVQEETWKDGKSLIFKKMRDSKWEAIEKLGLGGLPHYMHTTHTSAITGGQTQFIIGRHGDYLDEAKFLLHLRREYLPVSQIVDKITFKIGNTPITSINASMVIRLFRMYNKHARKIEKYYADEGILYLPFIEYTFRNFIMPLVAIPFSQVSASLTYKPNMETYVTNVELIHKGYVACNEERQELVDGHHEILYAGYTSLNPVRANRGATSIVISLAQISICITKLWFFIPDFTAVEMTANNTSYLNMSRASLYTEMAKSEADRDIPEGMWWIDFPGTLNCSRLDHVTLTLNFEPLEEDTEIELLYSQVNILRIANGVAGLAFHG